MITDRFSVFKHGGPPWKGAHWIPVVVISILLTSKRMPPDVDDTLTTALLGALGWRFSSGGQQAAGLPA